MILLAEHDEPSLAAKKKRHAASSTKATSTQKNRVWNFFDSPLGRPCVDPDLSWETATGSVQYSYENASGRGYYYTRDHLGSIRELTNSTGAIQARYDYDPYGRTTLVQGTNLSDFQYAGMYMHQTSELYLTMGDGEGDGGRLYDPNTARFPSRDPIGEDGGVNLYEYCANSPICYVDVFGLDRTDAQRASQFVHGLIGIGVAALAVGVLVGTLSLTVVASPIIVGGAVIISGVTIAAAGIYGLANMAAAFSPNIPQGDKMSKTAEDLPESADELASEIITGKKDVGKTVDSISTITTGDDIDKLLDAIDDVLDEIDEQLKDSGSPSGGSGGGCMDSSPLLTAPPMGLTPDGLRP